MNAPLSSIPTLDELVAHPELAATLSAEAARSLYVQLAALQAALSAALMPWPSAAATASNAPALLGVEDAAKAIAVAPSWLAEQARRGTFRSYKQGHYRRYDAHEVIEDFKALTEVDEGTIHRVYDRRRAARGADTARTDAGGPRRADRHHGQHNRPMGA